MGKFSSKPKSGPSAEEIRKQEQERADLEAREALDKSEANRLKLRSRAFGGEDKEQITRKTLLGQ